MFSLLNIFRACPRCRRPRKRDRARANADALAWLEALADAGAPVRVSPPAPLYKEGPAAQNSSNPRAGEQLSAN